VITPAATTIGIKTSVDGVLKYSSTYASQIAAGASVTITQDHIMDSGVHSASVFVDSESVVRETNESNNVKITSVDFGLPVPDVAITAPLNNAQIPGTVNITANATTVTGASISSVQFKDGGVNLGAADTSSPYALSWNTASATVGAHALTAVATDSWGHVNTSAIINVTVTRAMPDLTVLSTTFNRTTGILTSVIKNIGAAASPVTTVSFKTSVDGVVKYTPTYASSIAAGASVNVTQDHIMESGVHSVTVVADSASVVTETNEANNTLITSVNFGLPVPDVAITAPLNNATISGAVNITANATTVTGVAISSVQFKDGATVLGTDTSSPYALSWNTAITTNGGHALTAVATDAWGHVNTSAIINVTVNNGTAVSPYAIQGFAKTDGVTGGTGGVTRNVTNCYNDTRAGSFRAALAYNGPRIITFQPGLVCSNIVLAADVYIEYPNVTIDGAGANITFSTQTLFVRKANGGPIYNVIIKNLTFKDTVVNRQAIAIYGSSYKVWIDHNTFINNTSDPAATGQALGIFTNTTTTGFTGITISWNRFDPPGNDKCIAISEDNDTIQLGFRVSIHHNYFNECGARSPRVHGKGIYIHAWNNYHYAWREYGIGFGGYANLWVQNSIFENTSALYIKAVDPWYAQGAAGYYNSNSVRADNNTLVGLNGKPKPTIGTVGTFDTSKITYTFPLDLPDANLKARIIAGAGANR
jgi:pectate lyase